VPALAASAGAPAALVPSHAAEGPLIGVLFAVSALVLAGFCVLIDRIELRAVVEEAALILGGLLALYADRECSSSGRSRMSSRWMRSARSPSCSRQRA
jgi:hypothetical protein